jgi:hypothetical protein
VNIRNTSDILPSTVAAMMKILNGERPERPSKTPGAHSISNLRAHNSVLGSKARR